MSGAPRDFAFQANFGIRIDLCPDHEFARSQKATETGNSSATLQQIHSRSTASSGDIHLLNAVVAFLQPVALAASMLTHHQCCFFKPTARPYSTFRRVSGEATTARNCSQPTGEA